ncbi:hypothetical protein [Klebsiella pneumoniae IS22]|nr:hypothetical protein [Klebsiella pneumoniae IS22]
MLYFRQSQGFPGQRFRDDVRQIVYYQPPAQLWDRQLMVFVEPQL